MDQPRHSTPGDTYVPVPASEDCHPSLDPSVEQELQTSGSRGGRARGPSARIRRPDRGRRRRRPWSKARRATSPRGGRARVPSLRPSPQPRTAARTPTEHGEEGDFAARRKSQGPVGAPVASTEDGGADAHGARRGGRGRQRPAAATLWPPSPLPRPAPGRAARRPVRRCPAAARGPSRGRGGGGAPRARRGRPHTSPNSVWAVAARRPCAAAAGSGAPFVRGGYRPSHGPHSRRGQRRPLPLPLPHL